MTHRPPTRRALLAGGLASAAVSLVRPTLLALPQVAQTPQPPPTPAAPPQEPSQVFRAGVELVSLTITVTDQTGHYATDLAEADFAVFEDGVRQDLSFFTRSTQPIALSLLMDTSASMEDRLTIAQEAAIGFVKRLRPEDIGQVVDFDSRVSIAQEFTADHTRLDRAIRGTSPGGSTSLHNAVYISLKELARVRARSQEEVRRQAIVVLSDGEDTSSLVTFEEVLDLAKRSETAIYCIGLQPRDVASLRGFREAEYVLRQFAQETGGRTFFPQRAEDLAGIYGQIADELSSQYILGYAPRNQRRDGAWRRLVVRVARPGLSARTKLGYYAPTPAR